MEELMIPPSPNWYSQSNIVCTPDDGVIYGAMSKIVYIPPKSEGTKARTIDLRKKVYSFAIDPKWSNDSRRFAVITAELPVLVYDFATGKPTHGHKGHASKDDSIETDQPATAIAFLKQNEILSTVHGHLIRYSLATNSYKIFVDFAKSNHITILSQSNSNENLLAAGTKNGLIMLVDLTTLQVTSKFRGHDTEITSLDWTTISNKPTLKKLMAAAADTDCFDIYSQNENEQEFGVFQESSSEDRSHDVDQERLVSNSNFNFLEACDSLRQEILAEKDEENDDVGKFEDNKDQYGLQNASLDSNSPSQTPVLTEESVEEAQRLQDFVIVQKEDVEQIGTEIPVLTSGSREPFVCVWSLKDQNLLTKVKWHPKGKSSIPKAFTMVLWLNPTTLLVTDSNGDIKEYNVDPQGNFKLNKDKKFDAKGVLNLCKSKDGNVIWTASIQRHVSCLDVTKNFEKIVSLDTIQTRIQHLAESPHDSNVIAICGNDKRLCLWNVSNASNQMISLRSFMNKIQSGVLFLAWHPEIENLLAFSTREGRICVLDVNKSGNVPVIVDSFTNKEIYSMAWAKLQNSWILLACDGKHLVYFNQSENWKPYHFPKFRNCVSVSVNGDVLAVGTSDGRIYFVDISTNFTELFDKVFGNGYIGLITWNKDTVAVAGQKGVKIMKDVTKDTKEYPNSKEINMSLTNARAFSVRFNKEGNLIVVGSTNGLVQIWDIEARDFIASIQIGTPVFSAMFLPANEDFVICGAQESTVNIFEWRKYNDSDDGSGSKKRGKEAPKNIQWASPVEVTTIVKNSQRRQTKKVKKVSENAENTGNDENFGDELSEQIGKINLQSEKKKKASTIFHTAHREFSGFPLEFIEKLLSEGEREKSFNEKIFESREEVKEALQKELKKIKSSDAIGTVALPMLTVTTQEDLMARIESKTLTVHHVAIAASCGISTWRQCCAAFAKQLVEKDDSLTAIPYFLAANNPDACIQQLCTEKYFREAWVVAKMMKFDEDPIFDKIVEKWLEYLDYSGNYEAAAALLTSRRNYKKAVEYLNKRINKTEKCDQIIELLSRKTD